MSGLRHETLLGLDNVQLDLPVAPFQLRILAGALDYLLFGVTVVVLMISGLLVVSWSGFRSPWILAIFILAYFVLEYGYFAGLEIWMAGQTPGKKAFAIRVATRQGGRASSGAILLRNAFKSIDVAIGVPFMLLSPLGQRIGDRLAETIVLETSPAAAEAIVRRVPPSWGTKEIGVAEEFLRRAPAMEHQRADQLAEKLIETIERDSPGFLGPLIERRPVQRLRDELGVTES